METVENDGLRICEIMEDITPADCQTAHAEDKDNDNETVQVSFILDLFTKAQLSYLNFFCVISLPLQLEELYFYLFSSGLIRPPIRM